MVNYRLCTSIAKRLAADIREGRRVAQVVQVARLMSATSAALQQHDDGAGATPAPSRGRGDAAEAVRECLTELEALRGSAGALAPPWDGSLLRLILEFLLALLAPIIARPE